MDARITKQRLGNLLSYDWLKILAAIAAAVVALCVFFTTVKTRPREGQVYYVYAYTDLNDGADNLYLEDRLFSQSVFSYDILDVTVETFQRTSYGDTVLTARRSAHEGTVMFVTDIDTYNEDGSVKEVSNFKTFVRQNIYGFCNVEKYFSDCEAYLMRFYGANWETAELKRDEAEKCFRDRNMSDKRYRSESKLQAGIEEECARIEKLKKDYLTLMGLFENGTYSLSVCEDESGSEGAYGVNVGGLSGFTGLYYYNDTRGGGTVKTSEAITMLIFDNQNRGADLKFETVSFLCYLAERYAQ